MGWFTQTSQVTQQNLRSISQRIGTAAVTVVGVAGVVAVFISVLSMATGFRQTLQAGGSDRNVIILRDGSSSELDSGLSSDQINVISETVGLASTSEGPLASGELYVVVDLPKRSTDTAANVPLRGVGAQAVNIRDELSLVEGRMFEPGRMELIAGRGAAAQFSGLEIGNVLRFGQTEWSVVGIFEADGGIAESELWADVKVVQPAYRRGNSFSSVYAKLESIDSFDIFNTTLSADPRLSVTVTREQEYYAEQSQALSGLISGVGYGIAILMTIGAIFGAINTMSSAVSQRSREISTLKALGFGGGTIVVSVMVEALILSLIGAIVGGALAYFVFNGFTVSTLNFSGFSQVVFAFAVTRELMYQGAIIAILIGLLGGLLPAIRAAMQPVGVGMR